jgi:hypothetical protein
VSARRGPVLWSHVLEVRSRDCPFVAALLTFEAFDRSLVMDISTTQSRRNPWQPRRATPEIADYSLLAVLRIPAQVAYRAALARRRPLAPGYGRVERLFDEFR